MSLDSGICLGIFSNDLPTEYVWLSSIAYLLGGGPRTASVLILAMVVNGHMDISRCKSSSVTICNIELIR